MKWRSKYLVWAVVSLIALVAVAYLSGAKERMSVPPPAPPVPSGLQGPPALRFGGTPAINNTIPQPSSIPSSGVPPPVFNQQNGMPRTFTCTAN